MRQFDLVHSSPDVSLVPGLGIYSMAGPRYKLTSQTNILRIIFASTRWTMTTPGGGGSVPGSMGILDAYMKVILNRPSGLSDKTIICPWRTMGAPDTFPSFQLQFAGGQQSIEFETRGRDVRGDDIPNIGGIQLSDAGKGDAFSVELAFVYSIYDGPGGDIASHYYSVLADISDFSTALIRR